MSKSVIIVGGGPVGSVLALLLAKQDVAVTVLEARRQGDSHSDNRALVLSFGSRRVLEKLGLWPNLEQCVTAIHTIHVSQKGSIGRTLLRASDYNQEALGYALSYGALSAVLDQALAHQKNVDFIFEASAKKITHDTVQATVSYVHLDKPHSLSCALVVLADGGRSLDELAGLKRETREYGHDALVSKVRPELPHNNIAYERFTSDGPIALLPNGKRDFSLVWTGEKSSLASLLIMNDSEFLESLHQQFGDRVGKFLSVEKRMSFPLKMSQLQASEVPHLVVIGNAAQTMHPVAGQGFNIGLRDAETLAQHIIASTDEGLGSAKMLDAYRSVRKTDTKGGLLFTDFLVNVFSNDILGVSTLRGNALGILDILKPVKQHLVSKMSFGK